MNVRDFITEQGGIMKAVSKNTCKGQPGLMEDIGLALMKWIANEDMPLKHLMNVWYRQRALSVLAHDPTFKWLADAPTMRAAGIAGKIVWKPETLSELGRIADDDLMRGVALASCQRQPQTKKTMVRSRQFRTGKNPQDDSEALTTLLERTIVTYLPQHPHLDWSAVQVAVMNLLETVKLIRIHYGGVEDF